MTAPVPGRILVVDDDNYTRDVTARLLRLKGYQTLEADSGAQCLEVVQREAVDLILLDVMMPGMDGFQVCAALRELPRARTLPVILLTARDDLEARQEGMNQGVSEYLIKPISSHELYARVHAQLHIVGLTRALERVEHDLAKGARFTGR